MTEDLIYRPRRLRRTEAVRGLIRETELRSSDLIYPMFIVEGNGVREPIDTMPGQFRVSIDILCEEGRELCDLGIPAVNLFGYCEDKDDKATASCDPQGLVPRSVRALKEACPSLCVQTDVALDPFTHHGHDGLLEEGRILNDATLEVLGAQAVVQAQAGCDIIETNTFG